MISPTCGIKKRKKNKKQNRAHRYREQIGGCLKWGWSDKMGERSQKIQISSYKLNVMVM